MGKSRPRLLVLLLLIGTAASAHAALFKLSSELGVTHCVLPAVIGGDQNILHAWIRISSSLEQAPSRTQQCPNDAQASDKDTCRQRVVMRAKGFAMLQDPLRSVATNGSGFDNPSWFWVSLFQSRQMLKWKPTIFLRSTVTDTMQKLVVRMPEPNMPPVDPRQAFNESDYPGPPYPVTDLMIDFSAEWTPEAEDNDLLEYELRFTGIPWQCHVKVERHQDSNDATGSGDRVATRHYQHASLTQNTEVIFLMQLFLGNNLPTHVRNLYLHVLWHRKLGVTKHVQYMGHGATELASQPLIRDLISKGWLELVLFDEMPQHERHPLNIHSIDRYCHQILKYNHASLSMWGKDAVLLAWDMDEYLQTPKPMSVVQVLRECGNTKLANPDSRGISVMQIPRRNGHCHVLGSTAATEPVCEQSTPLQYSRAWREADLARVEAGLDPHPVWLATSMVARGREFKNDNLKYIMDPSTEPREIYIHTAKAPLDKPYETVHADFSCVRLLHLVNQHNARRSIRRDYRPRRGQKTHLSWFLARVPVPGTSGVSDADWWWPGVALNSTVSLPLRS